MSLFPVHTPETASEAGREILEGAQKKYGRVPNLMAVMAEAPNVAKAYGELGRLFGGSSFTPTERHVIWFTLNSYNGCDYCMAAHTAIAKGEKIADDVIKTAREGGAYSDPRLEELRQFALAMVDQRGWVGEERVQQFLDAEFTRQQVLEVILGMAHKTISNYVNHLAETPVDDAWAAYKWKKR